MRDNGFGIADLDDLFEPFYTQTSGRGDGAGPCDFVGDYQRHGRAIDGAQFRRGGAVFEVILPPIDEYNTGKEPFEAAE